jgi:hypothetical protein
VHLDITANGMTLDGAAVRDDASVQGVLGPADRRVPVSGTVPGLEDHSPIDVDVWDEHGLLAGKGFVAAVLGPNVLDEVAWPAKLFPGRVTLKGRGLDPATLAFDPLYEDRRVADLKAARLVVITDWDGTPAKALIVTA